MTSNGTRKRNALERWADRIRARADRLKSRPKWVHRVTPCGARHWRAPGPCRRPEGHDRWHSDGALVWNADSSWWSTRVSRAIGHRLRSFAK